ncbi:MAG: phosphoglucosamine mutase [Patescibacteria group bacterium]|jgi:phosphoglucosamine mutase
MSKYFGTDGIRGKAGDEIINKAMALRLGSAMAGYSRATGKKPKIIIGRDTRESGEALSRAAAKGIESAGGEAVLAGVIPTPALAFLTKSGDFSLGLEISASHNDASYNGFKLFTGEGDKLNSGQEKKIEELTDRPETGMAAEKEIELAEAKNMDLAAEKYKSGLLKALPENFNANGLKIVLDCANGANYKIAPEIFKKIGAEVIVINNQPDGKNINENCGSQYPENLRREVIKNKASLGLAFDGDGDRVIAVSEKGGVLNGDHLLYIFARMLKEKGELGKIVVSTSMSNLGFVKALAKLGIKHSYTNVGDREVYEEMVKIGAMLGGEESGHIIFRSFLSSGDGILTGLKLLEAMKYFKEPLSALAEEIAFFPKLLLNVPVKRKPELREVPEIAKVIKEAEARFGAEGRVVVRYSGTENLCRVMVEGREEGAVRVWADRIARVVEITLK